MKALLILTTASLIQLGSYAQPGESFKIKAGEYVEDKIPFEQRYRYPQFRKGTIRYVDGKTSLALINYNILAERIQLINIKNDTTFLKYNFEIREFEFDDEVLINDHRNGIVAVPKREGYPKLGEKVFMNVIQIDEGISNGYTTFVDPAASHGVFRQGKRDLEAEYFNSNLLIERDINYFIIDRNNRIYPALPTNLYKIFPRNKDEIRTFIKAEAINLKKEEDLEKLLAFCNSIGGRD